MTDSWPDPAVRAAKRDRRRSLRRRGARSCLIISAITLIWSAGLLSTRGVTLVAGILLATSFLRPLVEREASGEEGPFSVAMHAVSKPANRSGRLAELERTLDLATISAGDAQHGLRPVVVDIVDSWLEEVHGTTLEDPRARSLVPADVWALVRPTIERPADPHGPGSSLAELDGLISQLEALR